MSDSKKKSPEPKMHIVEIFDRDGKLVAGYPVREVGKLQARAAVLDNAVNVRRATENEIADIAVQGLTVLGIPRTAIDSGQGDLIGSPGGTD